MPTYASKASVEKNTRDIQALAASLAELAASVRVLAEGQKDLGELVRSQVEHNVEISTLKQNLREIQTLLNQTHQRIVVLEEYRLTTQAASDAKSGLIVKTVKYGPIIIAALLVFITIGIALKELSL